MAKKYSTGQDLYKKAKKLIPGGTMLLSKRPEMFLPDNWPAYYSKAKGCKVWDLENRQYTDMIMGIGPSALGYGHKEVDQAVSEAILGGNMSTLNCPEEVYLAEKLVELHPWSDMVRFARTGGEANAIAVRIARAASQKDNVAICGYHGWHDWYLSVNIGTNGLDQHLIRGLDPVGVPKNLSGTVFPFEYNNLDQLVKLVDEKNIGVIKMEVQRNEPPKDNFLAKVRELATQKNIVLIFDECSSGFRETLGGLHKKFGVNPDVAMFGKTMGNGYAVTAVIGIKDVMENAQSTFISSTFWTEKIGSVAALKTIEVMEDLESWNILPAYGRNIKDSIKDLARYHDLKVNFFGIDPLPSFTFDTPNNLFYKTYMTQEMLKKGFLATNIFYVSIEHTPKIVREFLDALDPIFKKLKECEEGLNILPLLDGPVCHNSFARLN
jgi:glutamate-1-semialdehyde 2,1-aminomutase